jgi:hypothetical protein
VGEEELQEEEEEEEERREEPVQRMATMARRSRSTREVPTGVVEDLDNFNKISEEEDHRIRPMARLRLLSTTTATETAMIDTMDREGHLRIPCRDLQTMVHLQAPGMAILKVKDHLRNTVRTTMVTEVGASFLLALPFLSFEKAWCASCTFEERGPSQIQYRSSICAPICTQHAVCACRNI